MILRHPANGDPSSTNFGPHIHQSNGKTASKGKILPVLSSLAAGTAGIFDAAS
jgi:hypothetical protein